MLLSDFLLIFNWWFVLFLIGVIFLPVTSLIFNSFFDRGYIFSKILGVLILSYIIFFLGSLKILSFTQLAVLLILLTFFVLNVLLISRYPSILISLRNFWKIFLLEELIFFVALVIWSYIRAHEPSIHGLEKYMDFGFVNSILRSDYFPPRDMWYTPLSINYYYFGHLITAVLTKLSGINSAVTYNLMIATLFALTFTGAFSIGANLYKLAGDASRGAPRGGPSLVRLVGNAWGWRAAGPAIAGLLTAFLVSLAGNLHTIYSLFTTYNVDNPLPFWQLANSFGTFPNAYWYPNATRFIPFTIHEFPVYSFVVSDLHGHVLSIPIVLTIIAVLLSLISKSDIRILLISFLLAVAYMTNAWDGLIYALLTLLVFSYLAFRSKNYSLYAKRYTLIIIGSILFSLPFSLNFKPFIAGIGIICAPEFLTKIGELGPFIFEQDHCQRSPLWQLLILHGFWYFWVIIFFFLKKKNIFILLLIGLSTFLIFLPEFIYAKDIYPAHYRANTMFKLGYQAFIMFGLATAYIIMRFITPRGWPNGVAKWPPRGGLSVVAFIGIIGLLLVSVYPYFAINSHYGGLKVYKGLNGLSYMQNLYPTDYEAVLWIGENIKGQPVILEANGESYTDYARVSANTGLPTVIGWPVHEWLWRGSYDVAAPRTGDVQSLYETRDLQLAGELIKKYDISLVFIGDLERQKYKSLTEENFKKLGVPIYEKGGTIIYQLHNRLE